MNGMSADFVLARATGPVWMSLARHCFYVKNMFIALAPSSIGHGPDPASDRSVVGLPKIVPL
jgi:hypothetical protein